MPPQKRRQEAASDGDRLRLTTAHTEPYLVGTQPAPHGPRMVRQFNDMNTPAPQLANITHTTTDTASRALPLSDPAQRQDPPPILRCPPPPTQHRPDRGDTGETVTAHTARVAAALTGAAGTPGPTGQDTTGDSQNLHAETDTEGHVSGIAN